MGLCVGVALAAACGLRVFAPLLVVGMGANLGAVELGESFAWMGTWPALLSFGVATVVETAASSWPWLDHALDAAAAPLALVAGAILTVSQLDHLHPALAWGSGIVAGGGVASATQVSGVSVRGVSTLTTGGLLNPVLNSIQSLLATVLSVLAVVVPAAAAGIVLIVAALGVRWYLHRRGRRARVAAALAG
ncbi:MAG: DUF4126 domain-containing protein [Planctomycetota bacterium]|nr:DUF4126 domain-containing protein [Planctomycetota bacterium]